MKEILNRELLKKYQNENGWISAIHKPESFLNDNMKERKGIKVLVSLKNNCVTTVTRRRFWNDNKRWWYSRNLESSVVAWQPLPNPYGGREDEEA